MGLSEALNNWRNLVRMAVGKPKIYPVKIVRNEAAKKYPLIHVKKDGDVGYDLPSIKRVEIPAMTDEQRRQYEYYMSRARAERRLGNSSAADKYEEIAFGFLPRGVIPTGIRVEMPMNVWCSLEARSSSSAKGLITPDAIIDSGYRGELFGVVFNLGHKPYIVEEGERVVQAIFHERILIAPREVKELSASERGESGFGSTGVKGS